MKKFCERIRNNSNKKIRISTLDSDLFVTKPMVTGSDEGTTFGMVIEPSPPFYHHHQYHH